MVSDSLEPLVTSFLAAFGRARGLGRGGLVALLAAGVLIGLGKLNAVEQCPLTGVAGTVDGELGLEEHMHVAKVLRDGEILGCFGGTGGDRKSTRLNSSHANISYA